MKLMIVDDHAGARAMIRELLVLPGVTIRECASGVEAVRCARDFKPDWVTMDVHMPGLNGFQAAVVIQREHPNVNIVIVTSDNDPAYDEQSLASGFTRHVCKENLIELRRMLAQDIVTQPPPEAAG
jgi:two-component system chemotaxis response regulator CheB